MDDWGQVLKILARDLRDEWLEAGAGKQAEDLLV
jgi:hypothetical protein